MSDNNWATRLLAALQALWPVDRPLTLALAEPDHPVWSMYPQAEAACNIRPNGEIVIYLRAYAMDTEYWREVLIHEYTHAAMADLLPTDPDDAIRQRVEEMTVRIAGLLDYAIRTGAMCRG